MFNTANILEALKNYIRTRGGQSAADNIAEAVNDLNSIPQGSGGGGMIVNVQILVDDNITFSADKTIAEIRTAYRQGRNVIAHTYDESKFVDWWLNLNEDSEGALFFGIPQNDEAEGVLFKLYAYSEDGVDTWVSDVLGNH